MGPNDAQMVRVFTREYTSPSPEIADYSFPYNKPIEIVVEAECGDALFDTGGQFKVEVCVRDLCAFEKIKLDDGASPPGVVDSKKIDGNFGGSDWDSLKTYFLFLIPVSELGASKEGAVCEVLATLQLGKARPDVSFAKSNLFMIHKP